MTKDKLITKQQLEIERFKAKAEKNKSIIEKIGLRFIAIGQPLNDNRENMNREQLMWVLEVKELIDTLE